MDILYYAKDREPNYENIEIVPFMQDICTMMEDKAKTLNIELDYQLPATIGNFEADPLFFRSLIVNLLENSQDACRIDTKKEKHKIYRELRDQLRNLDIDSRLDFYESPEELRRAKDPYMVFVDRNMSFPDPEDMIRPLFHSKSVFNVFGYANPKLDELLQMAEVERSWKKRIGLFHRMEEILFDDVPAIPLFSHQNRVAIQPYVRGVEYPSLGFYYLDAKKIWLDK